MPTRDRRGLEPEIRGGVSLFVSAAVLISAALLNTAAGALAIGTSFERSTILDAAPPGPPATQAAPTARPTAHPTATPTPWSAPSAPSTAPPVPDNSNNSGSNASDGGGGSSGSNASGGGGGNAGGGLPRPVVPPPVVPAPVLPPAPPPALPPYTDAEARAAVLRWYPAVPVYGACTLMNYGTWGRTSDPPPPVYLGILGFEAGALADGSGGWANYYSCE